MTAYAVKHLVSKHGPISLILKDVKTTPYSYTRKEREATNAARGAYIYVIEVRVGMGRIRSYWLGYKYRAQEKVSPAGGGRWLGEYEYKNSATWGLPPDGVYFDAPVRIEDPAICGWLTSKQPGMAKIPADLVRALEALIAHPANGAKPFV